MSSAKPHPPEAAPDHAREESLRMRGGPVTYILPDLSWSILLGPILQDAPIGSAIEVHTLSMFNLVEPLLIEAGRVDLAVRLVEAPKC